MEQGRPVSGQTKHHRIPRLLLHAVSLIIQTVRLREIVKGLALFAIVVGIFASAFAWALPDVGWPYRLGGPVVAVTGFGTFFWAHYRRDLAPDFLSEQFATYFDQNGFCFALLADVHKGFGVLRLYFQNRHERSCNARVAARPKQALFGLWKEATMDAVMFNVACPPAGYGVVTLPVSFAPDARGRDVTLQVGASVQYPQRRGRTLRFRDAITLRTDAEFDDKLAAVAIAAVLVTGGIGWYSPAMTTVTVPLNAAEPPSGAEPFTEIIWQLGASES